MAPEAIMKTGGVALCTGEEALFAAEPHLDGSLGAVKGSQSQQGLHRDPVLSPKGPAAVWCDDADPFHLQAQGLGHFGAVPERRLGGCNDFKPAVPLEHGPARLRFQIGMLLPRKTENRLNHDVTGPKCF
jgi:hypothetical protein